MSDDRSNISPLPSNQKIVNSDGTPTLFMIRWAQERSIDISDGLTKDQVIALLNTYALQPGTGIEITPDGKLTSDPTITLADTAVTPNTYGDATHVPQITVDQQGRLTDVSNVPISGGGGGGGYGSGPYVSQGVKGPATSGNTNLSYKAAILATTGLVSYYPLDDAPGSTTVADAFGPNPANVYKPFVLGAQGRIGGTCAHAPFGSTGGQNLGCCRIPTRIIGDDFSVELWLLITGNYNNGANPATGNQWYSSAMLWGQDAPGVTNDFGACLSLNANVYAGVGNPDTTITNGAAANLFDGQWHHLVFTRTKSTGHIELYFDGVSVATGTGGTQTLNALSTIQFASGPAFFADYAFYNVALSPATILAHYNAGKP